MADIVEEYELRDIFTNDDETINPSAKSKLIIEKINELKNEIDRQISDEGFDLAGAVIDSGELIRRLHLTEDKMKLCKRHVKDECLKDLCSSIEEYQRIRNDVDQLTFGINIVEQVLECHHILLDANKYSAEKKFTDVVKTLITLMELLNNPADGFQDLEIYKTLKLTSGLNWDEVLDELSEHWKKLVHWSVQKANDKCFVSMTINLKDDSCVDVLKALDDSRQIQIEMNKLGSFILKEILKPTIYNNCTLSVESDNKLTLTVPVKNQSKPSYEVVLANLRIVFQFLHEVLGIDLQCGNSLLKILGNIINIEFSDMLVKDCLVDTIPHCVSELQDYGKITSEIEDFQKYLTSIDFFPSDNFSILQYANNIDVIFANKTSQYFLENARKIMKKDLSITMSIGVETIPNNPIDLSVKDIKWMDAIKEFDKAYPYSPFYFPRCMVSKSAQELLDLVYIMMEQAAQGSDLCSNRMYYAARQIFELYEAIVPMHHEVFLQTIPQHVALFHNNCMYLAHNLLTLGAKWQHNLRVKDVQYIITFADQVPILRQLGTRHLAMHMQLQRKQILDSIRSSDLSSVVFKDVLGENAEQAIRQCVRQLQLLKNVWIGVFPPNVYRRLMGCLVSMFVEEIIHRVCTVEDISAEMASQLTDMYTIVVTKVPSVFKDESEVDHNVKHWLKLQELIMVLGGSLKDIEKRWADGHGPLAKHFTSEELRNLIRALFQNTQFRANLLAKIK